MSKRKNIYIEKKRKGQPCHTNEKKSTDTLPIGQKKKKHCKLLLSYKYKKCSIVSKAK